MPTVQVTNLLSGAYVLPGGWYTKTMAAGETVTVTCPDVDKFLGSHDIEAALAAGTIQVEMTTSDLQLRPAPTYATASLPLASTFSSGTVVFDTTTLRPIVSFTDIWRYQTTVTAGTTGGLAGLLNIPTNAVAFDTSLQRMFCYFAAAWNTCSTVIYPTVQAGFPALPALGQLTYNSTTQSLMIYNGATWDSVCVAPTGTTVVPAADAAALAGGMYWNTTTSQMALHNGAAWQQLNLFPYGATAALTALRGAVVIDGQVGWSSDSNRPLFYSFAGVGWFDEATVGMKTTAAATAADGVVVYQSTGFANNEVGYGQLYVYSTAPVVDAWFMADSVVNGYANVGALPVAADVPVGTLAIDLAGAGGFYLYVQVGGAWVACAP